MSYPIQTNMARSTFLLLLLPPLLLLVVLFSTPTASSSSSGSPTPTPTPTPWPPQFHATLFENFNGKLSTIELWYDWPNGRNFNIIRAQLSPDEAVVYDLEWNNGTSFIFSVGGPSPTCRTLHLEVGILRREWLDGAHYLGTKDFDGFLCHVWEKEQFIWYYEDVSSKRPVYWQFYTGRSMHVMNYELGAALEDEKWQAPAHCFENSTKEDGEKENFIARGHLGGMSNASLGEFASLKKSMGLTSA